MEYRDWVVCMENPLVTISRINKPVIAQVHGIAAANGAGLVAAADLVTVLAGHHDICEHDVGADFPGFGDRIVTVVDGQDSDIFAGETDRHDLLDRDAVVSQ